MNRIGTYLKAVVATVALLAAAYFVSASAVKAETNPTVIIDTSMGAITVELFKDKAPKSVANFLDYVKSGFYSNTIFHRVIRGFMIQGGGLTQSMELKPTRQAIQNEAKNGLSNLRGTLAMARKGDIDSATAQFFINTVDNARLDHVEGDPARFGYAVFGKVTAGMEVVDKIEAVATGNNGGYQNVPVQPVIIKSVKLK
jgi:cyclophilin family peptidyl-prolyl cis-trans isomerase